MRDTTKQVHPIDFDLLIASSKLNDVQKVTLARSLCNDKGTVHIKRVLAFCGALDRSVKDKTVMKTPKKLVDGYELKTVKD